MRDKQMERALRNWSGMTFYGIGTFAYKPVRTKLSQILEENPLPKYNLTAKACLGILRRAERRGKDLPERLKAVLIRQSQGASPQEQTEAPAPTEAPTSYAAPTPINLMVATRCEALGRGTGFGVGEPGDPANTISAAHSHGVFATAIPINDKATRWQGGGESRNHDGSGNGLGIGKEGDPSPTLTAGDRHGVMCAGFKLGNSEQVRSIGYQEELSPTLNAECGGNKPAVVAPAAMTFDTTQITSKENGSQPEFGKPCHTLNANAHVPCVALDMTHACDVIRECGEQVPALQARMGTGGNQVPLTYQMNGFGDYRAAECASSCKQRDFKDSTDLAITHMVVRRLTPMECERLQGFPDHWTDIGEWMDEKGKKHKDADSPRYKALGNSIALPFWDWMLRRMARYLPEGATLGSLFDGISGFNVCWARIHGAECCRWSSEIEQFPIAVTKKHFGDEKSGEKGDWDIFSGGMTW